ncbi:MAG: nuclear transport factor 2 family protein [Bacteroidota bacterium]|nr:nuclear transport factor 2 family protein [Bacteroidota bacterium]
MAINNQELALLFFRALNSRDFSEVDPYLHDEVALDFPGVGRIEGSRRVLVFIKTLHRKYPVLEFNVSEVFSDGGQICAIWTNKGENLAGEPYSNSGVTIFHHDQGKITFISDYLKDTSFIK